CPQVNAVPTNPNLLLVTGVPGGMQVLDVTTGAAIAANVVHASIAVDESASNIAFLPDGGRFVSAGAQYRINDLQPDGVIYPARASWAYATVARGTAPALVGV